MNLFGGFRSPAQRDRRRPVVRPDLERLESRQLLYSTLGAQWTYPQRITFSFVPDGTDVGGAPSSLFSTMASDGLSVQQWQSAFQQAAAIWQDVANVNLVQVSDNGTPESAGNYQQGDPNMGDIRISGMPLGGTYVGATYSLGNTSSIAGDIVMATDQPWKMNGSAIDLETVALHEFGHALGMGHSQIQQAVMYAYYTGTKQTLNTDDITGLDSIYGARQNDRFDSGSGNNWYTTATYLNQVPGFSFDANAQATVTGLDITSNTDQDWFAVTAPSNTTGTFTLSMQSSGLSLLGPRVAVYSASLQGLAQSYSTAYGDTVQVTISNVQPGEGFYIRAIPTAPSSPNSYGSYALELNFWGDDFQAVSWGDGSSVPTSGQGLVIAGTTGTAGASLLHVRSFDSTGYRTDTYEAMENGVLHLVSADASGHVLSDVPESSLSSTQTQAIGNLKQQLPNWLPPHVLSATEKDQAINEVALITGNTQKPVAPPNTQVLASWSSGGGSFTALSSNPSGPQPPQGHGGDNNHAQHGHGPWDNGNDQSGIIVNETNGTIQIGNLLALGDALTVEPTYARPGHEGTMTQNTTSPASEVLAFPPDTSKKDHDPLHRRQV